LNNCIVVGRWHWLSHSEGGLTPRAAHTAIYHKETDSLFVFGGYNLNTVLSELEIYHFATNKWEDENGNELVGADGLEHTDHQIIAAVLGQEERWGVPTTRSFFRNLLFSIADNSTLSIRHRVQNEGSGHLQRLGRDVKMGERETEDHLHKDVEESEEQGRTWDLEGDNIAVTEEPRHSEEMEELVHKPNSFVEVNDQFEFVEEKANTPVRPAARYGHAACIYYGGFVIYGGKLADGSFSDELWYYNVTGKTWSLRAVSSPLRPPRLTRHTLTLSGGDEGWLYLFGGSTVGGEFSSKLFRIRLSLGPSGNIHDEKWSEVRPRGGKELDVRVVAHSTVYHARTNSLLVYGGIVAGVARFSKLSDRMFSFQLDSRHWSEIQYPRSHLQDMYVPRERAFHTSTIIGNYLVVFGGYSHRHNKEEICYDNQLYLYHLGCHTWVSHEILGNTDKVSRYPKQQGVFAHAADVRNGNTLIIVGGYHGNVNADLLAYTLPPMLASREGETFEPEQVCSRYHNKIECTSNPECGWCSADEVCYGRTVGINCTTNLQTTRCPGICPALGDCHSCLIHGNASGGSTSSIAVGDSLSGQASSVAHKLRLDQCTWCVQNARCHHKDDNFGVCGLREDTPSQVPGWWGSKGTEVVKVEACRELDRRPGLTFLKYRNPANWSHPDSVTIINATTVDFNMVSMSSRTEQSFGGETIARLLGFLRPPESWGNDEMLRVCASYSDAVLNMSYDTEYCKLQMVANLTAELSQCVTAHWPSGKPVVLTPGRYLVDFESRITSTKVPYTSHHQSKMELHHNKSSENAKVFTFEYLEPYQNGSCHQYSNCLHCLTDSLCGWCDLNQRCFSRLLNEMEVCTSGNIHTLKSRCNVPVLKKCFQKFQQNYRKNIFFITWRIIHIHCNMLHSCTGADTDEWHYFTLLPFSCANCSNYITCESCVGSNLCEWWTEDARCSRRGRSKAAVVSLSQCPVPCYQRENCSQCLDERGRCVWCEATQTQNLLFVDSCSAAINEHRNMSLMSSDASWAYAQCPDVDECDLGLHDCHDDAVCTNTHGSYNCQCKRGFIGDGKLTCTKTCYNKCLHGYCVGAPDFACKCDLGWTGVDCGTNCGCHNHSTCTQGVGICDECQNWATGEFCQYCRPGSYGNATSGRGCHVCSCNGHGSEAKGICDLQTGVCFCQDNTEGDTCNRCKKGYYGDPRNGGTCYYQCVSRGMLTGLEPQGLGSRLGQLTPWESRLGAPPTGECLWIVTPYDLHNKSIPHDSTVQFTIHEDINISCQENSVYVYDGLPDFVSATNSHQSHVLGVFCSVDTKYPVTVEAKSGVLTVYYKQGDLSEGFNASYKVLSCPENCVGNHTCRNGQCACAEGWTGTNCSIEMCPSNCSSNKKQGVCDKKYGRCLCSQGFGGEDCSVSLHGSQLVFTQLFDAARLSTDSQVDHLRKQLPRFGHSLVVDTRGSLWMFGGFSLTNGPLNDIRLFDTKNNSWMPVTVDSTGSMPQVRYFHAAEIVHSRREIYVYGGLSQICHGDDKCISQREEIGGQTNNTLDDFWKFNHKNQRWIEIKKKKQPPPLAGHTLTLRRGSESESLILIGGFSPRYGFLETVWEFDLETELWDNLSTTGNGPLGVYGHSTVYHAPTQSFYIFGGYMYGINRTFISNKLYAFHYPTRFWSILPTFEDFNPSRLNLPQARYLHSAVTTDDYMLVFGGRSHYNTSNSLIAYKYSCNQWLRLLTSDVEIVGSPPPPTYAHAMTLDMESGAAFVIGGFDGGIQSHVTRILLPKDLCRLWKGKNKCLKFLGCNHCDIVTDHGDNVTMCYFNTRSHEESCGAKDLNVTQVSISNGQVCDGEWLSKRNCAQYTTCTECLAKWPSHINEPQVCKWCSNCARGRCIPEGSECERENKCSVRQRTVTDVSQCAERQCPASDCDKCVGLGSCVWTRQVLVSPEFGKTVNGEPIYDWNCVSNAISERSSIEIKSVDVCPPRCSMHLDCQSCLQAAGAEGGWHECRWSIQLGENSVSQPPLSSPRRVPSPNAPWSLCRLTRDLLSCGMLVCIFIFFILDIYYLDIYYCFQCISPSYQPLYCTGGVCGLVLRGGNIDRCPERCSTYKQCSTCLRHAHCGWCSLDGTNSTGQGVCTEGSLDSPSNGPAHSTCDVLYFQELAATAAPREDRDGTLGICPGWFLKAFNGNSSVSNSSWNASSRKDPAGGFPTFTWHYVRCPPENECINNHHTCDNKSEECVDLLEGFKCVCGQGYKPEKSVCVPVCKQGCVRGVCVEPDVCHCDFSYVGANCSIQCQCNNHANCAGPDKLDQCLECHNNTMGPQCEKCKPLFVGDPSNNGQCVPCIEYCNGHTHICINSSVAALPFLSTGSENSLADLPLAELEKLLQEGPTRDARCIGCGNRTTGDKCEECISGNFRGSEDHRSPCRQCECHGHGDQCDPVTGEKCNCQNNTESDATCSNSKNSNQCWKSQCSKCRDSYMGNPTDGHQCYRQMIVDYKFCFDAKQLEDCKMKPRPLHPGQTVFFVVQPRFMNVDIRVIVDVTQGALDLYMSPSDDTFVVNVNTTTGAHTVEIDPKFHWRDEEYNELSGGILTRLNVVEINTGNDEVAPNGSTTRTTNTDHLSPNVYKVMDREARGLTTFVTVTQKNTFLMVRNLKDRLVLTLPHDRHDLGSTRFYIALTAVGPNLQDGDSSPPRSSYGMVFFRQDQLHIDLFVFFSVFFSCFFLFLAACVVAWKAKQAADVRRARRRHVVEMLHMAKRPFATVTLLLDFSRDNDDVSVSLSNTAGTSQSPHRKKQRKQHSPSVGDVRPVAVEPTDDGVAAVGTVFVRLPGGREAPVRLALASSLILLARVYPMNGRAFLRRRSSHAPS
ncbi:hypothetical protein ANN_05140, partial [Periplaneta americana]